MERRRFLKGAAAMGALGLHGCGGGDDSSPSTPSMQQSLTNTAAQFGTQFGVPGLAASVQRNGSPVWSAALGTDLSAAPMQESSVFPWASISKQFLGALAVLLEQSGQISLNDTVPHWLPGAGPAWNSVRLVHLLTHTAGVPDFFQDPSFLTFAFTSVPLEQLEAYFLANYVPQTVPGVSFKYSNAGYFLAARMIDRARATLSEQLIQSMLFAPAGMTRSQGLTAYSPTFKYPVGTRAGVLTTPPNAAWLHGAGGLIGPQGDLEKWCATLQSNAILGAAGVARLTTAWVPQTLLQPNQAYGLGIFMDNPPQNLADPRWYHSGSVPGFSDFAAIYRSSGYTIVTLANAEGVPMEQLATQLRAVLG